MEHQPTINVVLESTPVRLLMAYGYSQHPFGPKPWLYWEMSAAARAVGLGVAEADSAVAELVKMGLIDTSRSSLTDEGLVVFKRVEADEIRRRQKTVLWSMYNFVRGNPDSPLDVSAFAVEQGMVLGEAQAFLSHFILTKKMKFVSKEPPIVLLTKAAAKEAKVTAEQEMFKRIDKLVLDGQLVTGISDFDAAADYLEQWTKEVGEIVGSLQLGTSERMHWVNSGSAEVAQALNNRKHSLLVSAALARVNWLQRKLSDWKLKGLPMADADGTSMRAPRPASTPATAGPDPRKVFVVHGRNQVARNAMFTFLRAIGLHPLEWSEVVHETGEASPYIGKVLETAFSMVQAAVILMTPDDEAKLREPYREAHDPQFESELTPQPRPNVLLEAGMALGLYPARTVIVEMGHLRPVSDILGRHVIRMNDKPERRQEFAQRLLTAGCSVNMLGTDWYTAGDFASAIAAPKK